jgi:hypothetical protein
MKRIFILLLLLICQHVVEAQKKFDFSQTGIKVAYMGSVTLPGFKVGVELPIKVITKTKQRSWGTKTILKERYWTLNLGFYHHPDFHDNLYLLAERQFRRQYSNGFFMELAPGVGYSRTFLGAATYALDPDGTVSKKSFVGYNHLMLSAAGGLGYDFSKTKNLPFKCFLKPSILVITPYNSTLYFRPTYEIGLIYKLGSKLN